MQQEQWLALTDYALRTGISISTLRRKIKANSVEYKMDAGKYLIRCDKFVDEMEPVATEEYNSYEPLRYSSTFLSSDAPIITSASNEELRGEIARMEERLQQNDLKWRAMEARVSGLAKRLEMFSEQISELKMLVKIFEEKLDNEI